MGDPTSPTSTALTRASYYDTIMGLARGEAQAKEAAKADPGTAIATIGEAYGEQSVRRWYLPVLARALDTTLSLIADPEDARKHLDAGLTPEAQAELAATFGDRFSVIAQIAGQQEIVAALQMDVSQEAYSEIVYMALLARAWAENLKDRDDWDEILEMEVVDVTVRDLVIAAIFFEVYCDGANYTLFTDALEDITSDMWDSVGLDPDDAMERLREIIEDEDDMILAFNRLSVASARRAMRERRLALEKAKSGQSEAPPETNIVEDIDI